MMLPMMSMMPSHDVSKPWLLLNARDKATTNAVYVRSRKLVMPYLHGRGPRQAQSMMSAFLEGNALQGQHAA